MKIIVIVLMILISCIYCSGFSINMEGQGIPNYRLRHIPTEQTGFAFPVSILTSIMWTENAIFAPIAIASYIWFVFSFKDNPEYKD